MKYSLLEIEKELKRKSKSYSDMLREIEHQEAILESKLQTKQNMLGLATEQRAVATLKFDINEIKSDLSKLNPYKQELIKLIEYQTNKQTIVENKTEQLEKQKLSEEVADIITEIVNDTIEKYQKFYTYEVIFTALKLHDNIELIKTQLNNYIDYGLIYNEIDLLILKTIKKIELSYRTDIQLEKQKRLNKQKRSKKKVINSIWASASIHAVLNWCDRTKGAKGW